MDNVFTRPVSINSERSWCWREVPKDFEKVNGIPTFKTGKKDLYTSQSHLSPQEGDRLRESEKHF